MSTAVRITPTDLMRVPEKAELIGGRIVTFMATGELHGLVVQNIVAHLRPFVKANRLGRVLGDNVIYGVPELSSGRESFSPDLALHTNPRPANREGIVEGPPRFAVEVRSPEDHGTAGERATAAKRDDYFEAGTLCVWDVNPRADTITKHLPDGTAVVYAIGDTADAEPAVPGWRFPVAEAFADLD